MAWGDHVQSNGSDAGSVATANLAYSAPVKQGNTGIFWLRFGASGRTIRVADTRGQTWQLIARQVQTTDGGELFMFYCPNMVATGPLTVTFFASGAAATSRLIVMEYEGHLEPDLSSSAQGDGATSLSTGNMVTEQVFATIIAGAGNSGGNTWTAGTGFTLRAVIPAGATSRMGTEDRETLVPGTYAGAINSSGGTNMMIVAAVMRPSGRTVGG